MQRAIYNLEDGYNRYTYTSIRIYGTGTLARFRGGESLSPMQEGKTATIMPDEEARETRDYLGIRKGLDGHSLGELEAKIMDIVWELDRAVTTTDVFRVMYDRRTLSYSTIMLTMAKLAKKGILSQQRTGDRKKDAFIYTPQIGREEMAQRLMEDIAQKLLHTSLAEAIPKVVAKK